jgi:hypothetical protein
MLNLEFRGSPACALRGNVRHRHQPSLGHQAPKILGVAPPHFSHAQHTDSQFPHLASRRIFMFLTKSGR